MAKVDHLFLLRELIKRDFQQRYAGSTLGVLWSLLLPVWQLLLFTFVFSTVMKISLLGERSENFAVFLFCGMIPWTAVHEGVLRSASAITESANLVKKLAFPPELLVVTVVIGGLIQSALAAAILVPVLVLTGEGSLRGLSALLIALPLQVVLTLGLGFLVATANVFVRDIGQLLPIVLQAWFFLSPIVYPLGQVPPSIRPWIEWNPLTAIVELYRDALLGGSATGSGPVVALLVVSLVFSALGYGAFRSLKTGFADEI